LRGGQRREEQRDESEWGRRTASTRQWPASSEAVAGVEEAVAGGDPSQRGRAAATRFLRG
jgi:hypothetical protein